jgi:hypothetical protein
MEDRGESMILPMSEAFICKVTSLREMQKAAAKTSVDVDVEACGPIGMA